jgi:hypothetical protein
MISPASVSALINELKATDPVTLDTFLEPFKVISVPVSKKGQFSSGSSRDVEKYLIEGIEDAPLSHQLIIESLVQIATLKSSNLNSLTREQLHHFIDTDGFKKSVPRHSYVLAANLKLKEERLKQLDISIPAPLDTNEFISNFCRSIPEALDSNVFKTAVTQLFKLTATSLEYTEFDIAVKPQVLIRTNRTIFPPMLLNTDYLVIDDLIYIRPCMTHPTFAICDLSRQLDDTSTIPEDDSTDQCHLFKCAMSPLLFQNHKPTTNSLHDHLNTLTSPTDFKATYIQVPGHSDPNRTQRLFYTPKYLASLTIGTPEYDFDASRPPSPQIDTSYQIAFKRKLQDLSNEMLILKEARRLTFENSPPLTEEKEETTRKPPLQQFFLTLHPNQEEESPTSMKEEELHSSEQVSTTATRSLLQEVNSTDLESRHALNSLFEAIHIAYIEERLRSTLRSLEATGINELSAFSHTSKLNAFALVTTAYLIEVLPSTPTFLSIEFDRPKHVLRFLAHYHDTHIRRDENECSLHALVRMMQIINSNLTDLCFYQT